MDINEVSKGAKYRHPWELSRTGCVLHEITPLIKTLGDDCSYINIGAGDMFFDRYLLHRFKTHRLYAVDLGYETFNADDLGVDTGRIGMYTDISEVEAGRVDYTFMMDVLEYIPDDEGFIRKLAGRVKPGGYMFFTLPAYQFLFSKHDEIVKNLRRYDLHEFKELISRVGGIDVISGHYFYFSLFIVRLCQKLFHTDIDPDQKVTTGWEHSENSLVTRIVRGILDFDYDLCRWFSRAGIGVPGLSLMVVCRKSAE